MTDAWRGNHPWAVFYDFVVERSALGGVIWKLGMSSDITKLYKAAEAIGRLPDGSAVLDIPCGGGVALRGAKRGQQIRYVAADIAPKMLERTGIEARKRGVDVELTEADAGNLPFADATFDLAVSFTGLHCFPDPERAVHELARVVKPGGGLTGSAFLTDSGLRYKPMIASGRAAGLLGPSATRPQLERWLREAGFADVGIDRSGGLTYFTGTRA